MVSSSLMGLTGGTCKAPNHEGTFPHHIPGISECVEEELFRSTVSWQNGACPKFNIK